jgi:diguanylate cyclase (GGDEF)-like protein
MNTDLLQQDRLGRSGTNANARGAAGSSWTAWLRKQREAWTDTARQDLVAEAYRPVLHRFLLVTTVYYLFVTWVYLSEEAGTERVALLSVSLPTALAHGLFHSALAPGRRRSLRQVEAIALVTNLLMYVNTLMYVSWHFHPENFVYFVLCAVVFSTTGVTLRTTIVSVVTVIATLFWFVTLLPPGEIADFRFIGVATSLAALGMAILLRKAIMRQIDARVLADELAARDSLTGIANRRSVFRHIEGLVEQGKPFWVGILDLDGFKSINDIYGHAVGDQILCGVVDRLKRHETNAVRFGRIGGDEFAIVVEKGADESEIGDFGHRLIRDISQGYDLQPLHLTISGTIGFAQFPTMANSARAIYEKADFALYRGKQLSRHQCTVFTVNDDKDMRESLALERALREAKLEDELHLVFQPQRDIAKGKVVSFEALARWQSPVLGPVRPDKFIRAAERAGLIQDVSRILFTKALDAAERWPAELTVSFNLSAQDLADRAFIFSLVEEVRHRNIAPSRIEFEITETAVMKDIAASRVLLEDLSAAGFKIALDDFGSGYSSFEYIDQLPLDKVKIDKSFVRKVAASATSREIVAGVITLCRNLGLKCVLEGVETEDEMQILAPLSPPLIQGYLYGKPMPQRDVLALLLQAKDVEAAASAA